MADKKKNGGRIAGLRFEMGSNMVAIPLGLKDTANVDIPEALPVMTLRNVVLFPGAIVPVTVGRDSTKALVAHVSRTKDLLVAVAQRDPSEEEPSVSDLFSVGTVARIAKVITLPDGNKSVILHGVSRVCLGKQIKTEPFIEAEVSLFEEAEFDANDPKFKAVISAVKDSANELFSLRESIEGAHFGPPPSLDAIDDASFLVNLIATNVDMALDDKQELLQAASIAERAMGLLRVLQNEIIFSKLKADIQNKARADIDKQQREYMLQQQMRTIQDELGDSSASVVDRYREEAKAKKWPDNVRLVFEKELDKFSRLHSHSAEYSVAQNYLDVMLSLPWGIFSKDNMDLRRAERRLNADHFGLEKVKERILEHLAVLKLKGNLKSPIICLYGPPGVGKTSLGRSIAEALGRKYVRMSLGGLHDESEIRGHRRTYVGAMPGRIIQNLKTAGVANPVFVLDEIDKVCASMQGDPASALLEVLDPEQNNAFHDNYLDVEFDLSNVMFIATANNVGAIPGPLLDRMELIPVDGYLLEEKVEIAERHLFPKALAEHGLQKGVVSINRKVMAFLIDKYTRESGVRNLHKQLSTVCRKLALKVAREEAVPKSLSNDNVVDLLGTEKFSHDIWSDDLKAGVVTGLAWTAVGGEILFVECAASKGKGRVTLTGNLGDVMKESAILAVEYVRSNALLFGLQDVDFDSMAFHIHVPEGAVPKDGPSAGITMVTAVVSALSGRRVRKRLAMTGEITLRGRVSPVGGITEKMLAAKRAGITDIVLCEENRKDINDIKADYVEGLSFHFVSQISQVIDLALEENAEVEPRSIARLSDDSTNQLGN